LRAIVEETAVEGGAWDAGSAKPERLNQRSASRDRGLAEHGDARVDRSCGPTTSDK